MSKILHLLAKSAKLTFKEKYFLYDVAKESDPHPASPPTAPAQPPAVEAATRREAEEEGRSAEKPQPETPKSMFEALRGKVTALDGTINKVIGNETYTKGLQAEAAKAKEALGKIQATMKAVDVEKVDMEALRTFESQLSAIEVGNFQGDMEKFNTQAKAEIKRHRETLAKIAKEEYNGEKLKERLMKSFDFAGMPPQFIEALKASIDKKGFDTMLQGMLEDMSATLDAADSSTVPDIINNRLQAFGENLPKLTLDSFITTKPDVRKFLQDNTAIITEFYTEARKIAEEEKVNTTSSMGEVGAKALALLKMTGLIEKTTAKISGKEPTADETPETATEKAAALTKRADDLIARLDPVVADAEGKTYTTGLVTEAGYYFVTLTETKLDLVKRPSTDIKAADAKIKAVEDNPALTPEALEANKAAKEHLNDLTSKATDKEAAMTPDQVKSDIFAAWGIENLPEPLRNALEQRFPTAEVTADLAIKFKDIKERITSADNMYDIEAIKADIAIATEEIAALDVDKYMDAPVFEKFNSHIEMAKNWAALNTHGGDGKYCKAAKEKSLNELTEAIKSDKYFDLFAAEKEIMAGFVADFVSKKIGKDVTPEQITKAMNFHGIDTMKKPDKQTLAILQVLNSPELKDKVRINWTASTNATPHDISKTLAEHAKMLEGLDELEEREENGTIDYEVQDITATKEDEVPTIGTFDKALVGKYRTLVKAAQEAKPGKDRTAAIKALNDFVRENQASLCAAGGHFDMATGILRARKVRKTISGKDSVSDTENERVTITLTNRPEDVGKGDLKAAGVYFTAHVEPEADQPNEDTPVAEGEEAPDPVAGAPSQPETPAPAAGAPAAALTPANPPGPLDEITPPPNPDGAAADKVEAPVPNPEGASGDKVDTTLPTPDGQGERTLPDGTYEKGTFSNNKLVSGTRRLRDGSTGTGTFDAKTGHLVQGTVHKANGAVSKGTFDRTTGMLIDGKYTNSDGDIAKGKFDPATGELIDGTYTNSDGNMEEGKFDPATGYLTKGKSTYSNGDVAEGKFDPATGRFINGKYTYPNGDVAEGTFDPATGDLIQGTKTERDGTVTQYP